MNAVRLNQMNRFVLRKQHLTEEAKSDDVVQIVRDVGGLHATVPTVPYLSLFSRSRNFTREVLDKELYLKKSLGKIRCVRKTVYILTKEMIPAAFAATKGMTEPTSEKYAKYLGITREEYEKTSKSIVSIIKRRGMTTREIKKALGTTLNISPIVNLMCDKGLVIRGNPIGGWKSNIHTYYLFHEYFPDINLDAFDEGEARRVVVEQYLATFGPATENDVAWWTGFPKGQIRRIMKDIQDRVSLVGVSETKGNYFILSSDKLLLMSTKQTKDQVINVLPSLDPYLMGYKERERYIEHKYYSFIFDRSGNVTSTILVDGQVVGVWDFREPFVKIFLFKDVKADILRKIYSKAINVGNFISGKEVRIKECDSMIPLTRRTAGGFMSPLKN